MFRTILDRLRAKQTPLANRLITVDESKIEGWVRARQHEPDVASDALALLIMMAAGRFLKEHLTPPPAYLGRINVDVMAYEVLRYVKSAVGHALPTSRVLMKCNSDTFLVQVIERETGWNLKDDDFFEYMTRDRKMAEEFQSQLESLHGINEPGNVSAISRTFDMRKRLELTAGIAAFQQTIPAAIAATVEEMIRVFNLGVERDDRVENAFEGLRRLSEEE